MKLKLLGFAIASLLASQAQAQMLCEKQVNESISFLGQNRIGADAFGVRNTLGQWLPIRIMNSKDEIKALSEEFERAQSAKLSEMRKHLLEALSAVSTNPNNFAKKLLEQVPIKNLSVETSSGKDFVKAIAESATENELASVSQATAGLFGSTACEERKQSTLEESSVGEREYKACLEKSAVMEPHLLDFHKAYESRRSLDAVPALVKYQRPTGSDDLKILMRTYPIMTIEATWISKYNHLQTIDLNVETCRYHIARFNQQTTQYEETETASLSDYLKQFYRCTLPLHGSRNQWACSLLY